jgi:hypothetical protein
MLDLTRRSVLAGVAATALTMSGRLAHAEPIEPNLSHLTPEQRAAYRAMHERMRAALAYERITVPGEQAEAEWQRLKAEGRGWPVIVGSDADLERIADQFSILDPEVQGVPDPEFRSVGEIIAAAGKLRFPDDLHNWPGTTPSEELRAPVGDWPVDVPENAFGLTVTKDLPSGRSHERVHILLIPTKFGWEVPAYLKWGGWNACPPPEYHMAALRHWHEDFGAELVAINGDTLNLKVARRPSSREQALALAREQYAYCPDIVDQGTESLSALAASLIASDWWYFWWD